MQAPHDINAALADRYRIERSIGAGGMATVYLAEDLKHHRQVAIKVLKPEISAAIGTERFLSEIAIAARLNHPNILALHDSGEAAGFIYYVAPYVEGNTLRSRLAHQKQLGIDEALRIAEQVATALEYAHRQGVVHRDIKPENILLHEGSAVVADFGIALAINAVAGERLTQTGFSLGTPEYMSPEQAAADRDVDGRSDVYSLGCLLYEMLAGEPPYTGRTAQAVMAKCMTDRVPSVRRLRESVSLHLDAALAKALAKAPNDRFQTAGAFREAICRPVTPTARRSIAVLPFTNLSADAENEYFSDGITEDLIAQISKIRDLKVISRTSTMRYKGADKPLRMIGDELGVATILEGSVRRGGSRVRVVAQLIDAETDEHLWAETYDRELTDVFAIQSEVALQVAAALQTALSPAERTRVQKEPTKNMEAYDLYLLGRHQAGMRSDDGLRRAVEYFERALEKDPAYAAACAGLADAYVLSGIGYRAIPPRDAMAKAKEFALKALALDDALPEAHSALGYVYLFEWDWLRSKAAFERAIASNPSYATAHQWFSHYFIAVRDFQASLVEIERARSLDPFSVMIANEMGWPYHYMGLQDRAREHHRHALEMDPSFAMAHYNIAVCSVMERRYAEALPSCARAIELAGRLPFMVAALAAAYAHTGRAGDARRILDELITTAREGHGVEVWIAYLFEALGDPALVLEWLERGFDAHAPFMNVIGTAWLPFESVRDDSRFRALLQRMGLGNAPMESTDRMNEQGHR